MLKVKFVGVDLSVVRVEQGQKLAAWVGFSVI